jgi:hypothetical protein
VAKTRVETGAVSEIWVLATAALTTTTRPEVPRRLKKEEEAKRKSREDPEWPA